MQAELHFMFRQIPWTGLNRHLLIPLLCQLMLSENILNASSFKEIISRELDRRCQANDRYSLRSFARKLRLPPSTLSEVLNGKRGLSKDRAQAIAHILEMNPSETEYFVALVESVHARSQKLRALAKSRVEQFRELRENPIHADRFKMIAEWQHLAILELSRTEKFSSCPIWISQKLGISLDQTREAVQRLLRLDLLRKEGERLQPGDDLMQTSPHDIPSECIRKFHMDLLKKALLAVESQSTDSRNCSSLIFAIDASNSQQIQQAKKLIMDFNRKLNKIMTTTGRQTHLYCFSTQLYCLEEAT